MPYVRHALFFSCKMNKLTLRFKISSQDMTSIKGAEEKNTPVSEKEI
jgi:hypothetical protein